MKESRAGGLNWRCVKEALRSCWHHVAGAANRYPSAVAIGVFAISLWPLVAEQRLPVDGDVGLYQAAADNLFTGKAPYRDGDFEYPPYALAVFAAPRLLGQPYPIGWIALAIICDSVIKYCLFVVGVVKRPGGQSLLPLLFYSASVPFIRYFYFERYDLWPALVSLVAILLFCSGRPVSSGIATAVAAGLKVYPILFVPVLAVIAVRQARVMRFLMGLAGGFLPLGLLSFPVPWWRFARFQAARGLQAESLYSSVLWLGKRLGVIEAEWIFTRKWLEVSGSAASAVLPWARVILVAVVLSSTGLAVRAAARSGNPTPASIARLLLLPLLAFVVFNQVLSPQFIVWVLPLAALATVDGRRLPLLAILLATVLTPIFYPSIFNDYVAGLGLFETAALVCRNLVLVVALGLLILEALTDYSSDRLVDDRAEVSVRAA